MPETVNIGIIGGGLMGREIASAFARWCALDAEGLPTPVLRAVCDVSEPVLGWFRDRVPTAETLVGDYHDLLSSDAVDVVYVAVPHHLHEKIYLDVLNAGKDLLAEKPFGIDLAAAGRIAGGSAARSAGGQFVRCSSEFPFFPGVQEVVRTVREDDLGRVLEVNAGFHHSSDLDPSKPANWKRLSKTCGEIGVMGDLGMHVLHVPLRLGWDPARLFAQLQKGYPERPNPDGTTTPCDTWDNATLHAWVDGAAGGGDAFPMRLEMKRLAPGATNTWWIEVLGTEGGVRYSTAEPKSVFTFSRKNGQAWSRRDLGFGTQVGTVTGGIFEFGFPDAIQQMWAAYLLERGGDLGGRFGCVTPSEALRSHQVFAAALESHAAQAVTTVPGRPD